MGAGRGQQKPVGDLAVATDGQAFQKLRIVRFGRRAEGVTAGGAQRLQGSDGLAKARGFGEDLGIHGQAQERRRGKLPETDADAGGIFALAMGKGGARELNYSSDIDLIVLFDETAYADADQQEARAALIRATAAEITSAA